MENCRFIPGYDNKYAVDKNGNVISYHKGKAIVRKTHLNTSGYLHLRLINKGKDKSVSIHSLVAQCFIPNSENKPQVNHIDGNKLNNYVGNLEWVTNGENQKHAYANGLRMPSAGEKNCKAKLTEIQVNEIFSSSIKIKELCKIYNVSQSTIYSIKRKSQWKIVLQ